MGWQSETEVARLNISSQKRASTIQAGRGGRAFIHRMASVIPCVPDSNDTDSWGPKWVACTSPAKTTTDEIWEATKSFLSLPCVRAHLHVKEFDFSEDHPAAGGIWEIWFVMDSALLRAYLHDFQEEGYDIPEDMWRVLNGAHEHDDGQGGRWETVIIKHTVV